MRRLPDMRAVAGMLAECMDALAAELVREQPTSRRGGVLRFRRAGSLVVFVGGARRGTWFDHDPPAGGRPVGAGGAAGGDALDLVSHMRGCDRRAAWEWALAWLGEDTPGDAGTRRPAPVPRPVPPAVPDATPATMDLASRLWREATPADGPGSLVPIYLASRGLRLEPGAPLRFHPYCRCDDERWPAMLALMSDPATGQPCGVHRTFLARDGSGKAPGKPKKMAGRAGIICLAPAESCGLGLAEGIETSLAVMQGFGWRPVWAAGSAGAIRTFPVLDGMEALTVFSDPDGAGQAAAIACAERWRQAGREVSVIAPLGRGDFADLVRERAA